MKIKSVMIFLALGIFLISFVSSFGVSAPYWETRPANFYPGQIEEIPLNIQNGGSATETIVADLTIVEGSEIITHSGSEKYRIPAGSSKTAILNVVIPEDAKVGTVYPVKIEVIERAESDVSGVSLKTGMIIEFDVNVVQKPDQIPEEEESFVINFRVILVIAILVLALVILILVRKKHNKIMAQHAAKKVSVKKVSSKKPSTKKKAVKKTSSKKKKSK